MRIKKQSIQNLTDSILLSEHLRKYMELKRSGGNWLGLCPFHQDSTPSFYVYPNNYHCFACNAHGSIINFEMHRTGLSFKETVEQLAQAYHYTLDYSGDEWDSNENKQIQIQQEQSQVLTKIANNFGENQFSPKELEHLKSFHYRSKDLKKEGPILPLLMENGHIYGLVFFNLKNEIINTVTLSAKYKPCLYWNDARPSAVKEKQLIVTYDYFDWMILSKKGIQNIVVCFEEVNDYLLKQFAKRVRKLVFVIPETKEGKKFLWTTFQNTISFHDLTVEVVFTYHEKQKRELFFSSMTVDKVKNWLQNSQKIHIKVTEFFLNSLPVEKNKLQEFQYKIRPIIETIKEPSKKNALLADISNEFFYSSDINKTQMSRPMVLAQKDKELFQKDKEAIFIELMSRTVEYYHNCLVAKIENQSDAMSYLVLRGFSLDNIKKWKIGFCFPSHDLSRKAQSGLISKENLEILGVIKKRKFGHQNYDFFHDRIIIPIQNHKGEFVALSGRILPTVESEQNKVPKYINSPESEIFSKSKVLFNFYRAINAIIANKYAIIVEGYMDCISLTNAGIDNVVAVMGTALTKSHLEELSKITKRIVLCFDNDKAGQAAAKRSFACAVHFQNIDLEYLVLPESKDPDEFIKKFGKEKFLNLAQNKNTPLYEKICEWCHSESKDNQEFVNSIQNEFQCLADSENDSLIKQISNRIFDKYNVNLRSFFVTGRKKKLLSGENAAPKSSLLEEDLKFDWPVKNPLEIKLLLALLFLKFTDLPQRLQNIMLNLRSENENEEVICAQALENQFSRTGFQVFLEISSWMLENRHISISYIGSEMVSIFSEESQILMGFAFSDVKILMGFNLQELIKDSLSSGISMVLSQNVWNLKNAGFLKFILRNIKLAFQNGVLQSLFEETLIHLEVNYIDSALKACSSLHFDNDLDAQFQFFVSERVRCQAKLGNLNVT